MTDEEITRLRTLCDAATPGPWMRVGLFVLDDQCWWLDTRGDNTAFITAAREAVPALLDEVEKLRAALKPFAERAALYEGSEVADEVDWFVHRPIITVADLRRAREALGESK